MLTKPLKLMVDGVKYQLDEIDLDDFSLKDTALHLKDPSPFKCNLEVTKAKQQQQQDMHMCKIITKCRSEFHDKTLYYLDEHGIAYYISKINQIFSCSYGPSNFATLYTI